MLRKWKLSRVLTVGAGLAFLVGYVGGMFLELSRVPLPISGEVVIIGGLVLFAHGMIGATCAVGMEQTPYRWFMFSGLVALALSAVCFIGIGYVGAPAGGEPPKVIVATSTTLLLYGGQCGLYGLTKSVRSNRTILRSLHTVCLATGTLAIGLLLALVWDWAVGLGVLAEDGMLLRLAGASALICVVTGVIARLLMRGDDVTGVIDEDIPRMPFAAFCPRCSHEQTLETGGDQCGRCGLRIEVTVL